MTTHTHTHTHTNTILVDVKITAVSKQHVGDGEGWIPSVCVCVSVCEFGHVLQNERIPSDVCPRFSLCRRIYVEKRKRREEQKGDELR